MKIKRCKKLISKPNYFLNRAIQMGETYGAIYAEKDMLPISDEKIFLTKLATRFYLKMQWYINKQCKLNI